MKIITINIDSGKLKICSVEMPNAPYSNRWSVIVQTLCNGFFTQILSGKFFTQNGLG